MQPSVLVQAWQSAAKDLGIEIIAPYTLMLASGASVKADLLVREFGSLRGMLVSASEDDLGALEDGLVAEGYSYSAFVGDELVYDRRHFIDILNDWHWNGPDDKRPVWSK